MTTTRVELPGDHWAEIRDPMTVTERDRRPLKAAYATMGLSIQRQAQAHAPVTPGSNLAGTPPQLGGGTEPLPNYDIDELLDATDAFEREAIAFCVTAWDFEAPVGVESLDDLPAPVFTALSVACADVIEVLFPRPVPKDG